MSTIRERVSEPIRTAKLKAAAIAILFVLAGVAGSAATVSYQAARAERHEADQARLALAEAFKTIKACLGEKEGALWIGGELHLCRAVPTGIKR